MPVNLSPLELQNYFIFYRFMSHLCYEIQEGSYGRHASADYCRHETFEAHSAVKLASLRK